jgi:hypothetical protein
MFGFWSASDTGAGLIAVVVFSTKYTLLMTRTRDRLRNICQPHQYIRMDSEVRLMVCAKEAKQRAYLQSPSTG